MVRKFYINDIQDTLQSIDFNDDIDMELFLNLFYGKLNFLSMLKQFYHSALNFTFF